MLAAVLFTDIVGSTERATQLGDSGWRDILSRHHAIVRAELVRFGGREVDTAGDGFFVVFDVPASAVRCARSAIDALAPLGLQIRAGVHTGEVSLIGDKVGGIAAHIGARVMATAGAGEVLVSSTVRDLVTGSGLVFSDRGPHTLKGFPEPWHLYRLESTGPAHTGPGPGPVPPPQGGGEEAGRIPLPARLQGRDREGDQFVGRADELGFLVSKWKQAAAGDRRAVLVGGEPGIGKTLLATEMAVAAHGEGAVVLFGRCEEDLAVPYQPFVEALRHYVAFCPAAVLGEHVNRHGGELARLLPELAHRVPGLPPPRTAEPATERYWLFEACTGLLATASQSCPVVLVLDDLHWATTPTLLLLKHLLGSTEPMALLVIATYRTTDLSKTHPFTEVLADLHREHGVERVLVHGLGDPETAALVQGAGGHELDDKGLVLAHALRQDTEGNPFFMREILRHLVQSGTLYKRGERWTYSGDIDRLGIPPSVREVISRRVLRLSDGVGRLLSLAAVIGREFDLAVLSRVADASEEQLLDAMEEATGAALVAELPGRPGRFTFAHALIRHTLYEELSSTRRVRLHRRVGDVIEASRGGQLDEYLPELSHHYSIAAADGDGAKAVTYAHKAGQRSLDLLANHEAVSYFRQALDLVGTAGLDHGALEARRCDLMISLGEAERRSGEGDYRQTLLDGAAIARRLGDPVQLAQAALANNRGFFSTTGQVDQERVRVLQEAIDAYEPGDSAVRARLLAHLAVELVFNGDWDARVSLSDQALAMARRVDDTETLVLVLNLRSMALRGAPTTAHRVAISSEARRLAADLDNPTPAFYAAVFGAHAAMEAGDIDTADHLLESSRHVAQGLGQPILDWYWLVTRVKRELISGSFAECERLALEAFAAGQEAGQEDAAIWFTFQFGVLRLQQDRASEVVVPAEAGLLSSSPTGSVHMLGAAALAVTYAEVDREADARRTFDDLMVDDLRDLPLDFGWLGTVALSAQVCSYLDDRGRAEVLHRLLEPYRGQFVDLGPGWLGSTARYLGLTAATLAGPMKPSPTSHTPPMPTPGSSRRCGWLASTSTGAGRLSPPVTRLTPSPGAACCSKPSPSPTVRAFPACNGWVPPCWLPTGPADAGRRP